MTDKRVVIRQWPRRVGMTLALMEEITKAKADGCKIVTNSQSIYTALTEQGYDVELVKLPKEKPDRAIIRYDELPTFQSDHFWGHYDSRPEMR